MKWVVVVAFVLIIGSLGSAMVFLIRDRGKTRNVARALGFRVGFSIALFLLILFRVIKGHFSPDHHFAFEAAAWYWHFVDVVWLGLYVVVYWL